MKTVSSAFKLVTQKRPRFCDLCEAMSYHQKAATICEPGSLGVGFVKELKVRSDRKFCPEFWSLCKSMVFVDSAEIQQKTLELTLSKT